MLPFILTLVFVSGFSFILGLFPPEFESRPTLQSFGYQASSGEKKKSPAAIFKSFALLNKPLCSGGLRERLSKDLSMVTGQKAAVTRARKSVSGFKVREGNPIGCMVTLRGARMYECLDRLINVVMPRIRDFRGLPKRSFDGYGNYSLGISEQIIFPEINIDKVEFTQGMDVTIVIRNGTDAMSFELLTQFGMPFRR